MSEEIRAKSPEELLRLMAETQSEYSIIIRGLKKIERQKMKLEASTTIILHSKSLEYIKNEKLKKHLEKCYEDDKFKPTVSFVESCVYLENEDIMEEHNDLTKRARYLEKEFDMLSSQLIYHQSKNKVKTAEIMNNL